MIENDLCLRQAFIYSTKDHITDSEMIDRLIEKRKERGIDVMCLKFDDSDHVLHLRKHPKEYSQLLDHVLKTIQAKKITS